VVHYPSGYFASQRCIVEISDFTRRDLRVNLDRRHNRVDIPFRCILPLVHLRASLGALEALHHPRSGNSLRVLQLSYYLGYGGDFVEIGEVSVSGERVALPALYQNLCSGDAGNVCGQCLDQRDHG